MIISTAITIGFIHRGITKLIADGRARRVDGRSQALVGPGLATPLSSAVIVNQGLKLHWYNLAICSYLKFDNRSGTPQ